MSLRIRMMAAQDLDPIMALANAAVEAPQWTRRDYEQALLPSPTLVKRAGWVADSRVATAGFIIASYLPDESEAELETLVVDARHRRQGLGSALLAACRTWAASQGALALRLEVRASNAAALALYHRHGFSQVGLRRDYYSAPVEDALLLRGPSHGNPLQR